MTDDDLDVVAGQRGSQLEGKIQERSTGVAKDQGYQDVDDWYGAQEVANDPLTGTIVETGSLGGLFAIKPSHSPIPKINPKTNQTDAWPTIGSDLAHIHDGDADHDHDDFVDGPIETIRSGRYVDQRRYRHRLRPGAGDLPKFTCGG